MAKPVNLRAAVRDGIITPQQAARIEGAKALRPRWWARALGVSFMVLIAISAVCAFLAIIVFSIRIIVG
jgi:hypothetical protein